MIQVTVGNNTERVRKTVSPDATLRSVLDDAGIRYESAAVHLDGASLKPGDINKTFAQMGVTESCYLLAVIKADNA